MAERSERAGFVALLIAGQFHHHNACDDEGSGEQAHRRCGLTQDHNADKERANCSNTRPDRVCRAERQRLHRDRQQGKAGDHGKDGDRTGYEQGEAVGLLHEERPYDFQQSRKNQKKPGHSSSSLEPGRPGH